MEDEIHYGEQSHVHNTEGCDVHFNQNNEELISVNLTLTEIEIKFLRRILISQRNRLKDKEIREIVSSLVTKVEAVSQ